MLLLAGGRLQQLVMYGFVGVNLFNVSDNQLDPEPICKHLTVSSKISIIRTKNHLSLKILRCNKYCVFIKGLLDFITGAVLF